MRSFAPAVEDRGCGTRPRRPPGRPAMHIGVHAGDVAEREGDFLGHAVNIAARVASEARPGEILVTGDALRDIDEGVRDAFALEPLGEVRLRNVSQPIALYRIAAAGDTLATDPVCRMRLRAGEAAGMLRHAGKAYSFCSLDCARRSPPRASAPPISPRASPKSRDPAGRGTTPAPPRCPVAA